MLQKTFVDAPVEELDEEEVEELAGRADSNKYRGPVDSTLEAQELLESSIWHSIWHIFWHSIWHIFWHSI